MTDEQDRLITARLRPDAETKSRANALYAEALLTLESPQGQPQQALDQLSQVIALDPHFAEAQVKTANLMLQLGQTDSALKQLRAAATANPDSVAIETALGYTLRLKMENDEAYRLSADALARDPNQPAAMRVILEIAADKGDLASGAMTIDGILKADGPGVPTSAWLALAKLYIEAARTDYHSSGGNVMVKTLLPIYQAAASQTPPDVQTLSLLADVYRELGQKREALKTLQQAGALEPSNVDIILRYADLETDLNLRADALKHYERAFALNPSLTGLREMLARLYLDNNRFDDAARLLQELLADTPDAPGVEVDLGIAYEGTHQQQKARECFRQAFTSTVCPPEVYLKLAVYQLGTGQVKEAGKTLADARVRFPGSAKIRFYQGIQYRYAHKYDDALSCLSEVGLLATGSEADALDVNYYLENVLVMSLAGKKSLIEPMLHEGLRRFPDNPDLMNELAYFWADQGVHLPECLDLSRRAAQLDPDNGAIQDTLGWTYFKLGHVNDALPYLQRAALMTDNDPVVLQHLGDACLRLGRAREAVATWRHALAKDPGNHDLIGRIDAAMAQANHAHLRSAPHK